MRKNLRTRLALLVLVAALLPGCRNQQLLTAGVVGGLAIGGALTASSIQSQFFQQEELRRQALLQEELARRQMALQEQQIAAQMRLQEQQMHLQEQQMRQWQQR